MPKPGSPDIDPFSEDDVRRLLAACEVTAPARTDRRKTYHQRRATAIRDKALLLLLLDTGMRIGECSRLRVGDINLDTGEVTVRAFGRGLKTAGRIVLLGQLSKLALWRYLSSRDTDKYDALFLTDENQPMAASTMRALFRRLGERASVPKCHPHRCRHTFAIEYLRNGSDIYTLQTLLGHKTLDMCKRYLKLAHADISTAHRRASPVDRWRLK